MEFNEVIQVHKCFSIQYVSHWNFLTSINFVIVYNLKSILIQLLAFFSILTEIQKNNRDYYESCLIFSDPCV